MLVSVYVHRLLARLLEQFWLGEREWGMLLLRGAFSATHTNVRGICLLQRPT